MMWTLYYRLIFTITSDLTLSHIIVAAFLLKSTEAIDNQRNTYDDPEGQIFLIVGTRGQSPMMF